MQTNNLNKLDILIMIYLYKNQGRPKHEFVNYMFKNLMYILD